MVTDAPDPWERQPGEGPKPFAAFQVYRDMLPTERSLRRLAGILGKSMQLVAGWSSRDHWQARVAAWDGEQDRLLLGQLVEERKAFARRLAAQGALLQSKGINRVRAIVDRIDRDGAPVELQNGQMYTDDLSVVDAVRLIEVGARLEAMGRGLPADNVEQTNVTVVTNPIIQALTLNPANVSDALEQMHKLARMLEIDG